ncbi:MAG: type II toxin-antitoxin system MqsA family antitoxin [Defluviitaleaceae bacterium]|nr:type II toxin-antitoxin system MqsA family antitoxin [Defluviitaleaceae bacterium]MCL2276019.1 type II toxin-antitoxin system MqsA family antitoxin [Defluviitaleaceae bacterium]
MNCFRCTGYMEPMKKTHTVTLKECVIIVKQVPALVCNQCGETYFTDEVMQKLDGIFDKLENLIKEVAIVEYLDTAA